MGRGSKEEGHVLFACPLFYFLPDFGWELNRWFQNGRINIMIHYAT